MKAEEIVELILKAARESRVFGGGRTYKDEPIVRTGRQAYGGGKGGAASKSSRTTSTSRPTTSRPAQGARDGAGGTPQSGTPWSLGQSLSEVVARTTGQVPERIAQMRSLARGQGQWAFSYADPKLFYEQALFMEDYVDSCPYVGDFTKYYPTYEDMTTAQLRGYFTWRTRWRAGEVAQAPLSYLFVHAYELLCGVGVKTPPEGFAALSRLRDAYGSRPGFEALSSYLAVWMSDYATYHGIPRSLLGRDAEGSPLDRAIGVLDQAEQALVAAGCPSAWSDAIPGLPSHEDLVFALTAASRYRLERSKVFSDRFDELGECCAAVFARMVQHCARRRKRGFVQGLFGEAEAAPYTMFRSAVFYDPTTHPDCEVRLESGVVYQCRLGRWTRRRPHSSTEASSELGDILHEVDRTLRLRLGGMPELKAREVPKYQAALIDEEVTACLERRAAEEAAKVRIDRSALTGIRAASVRTREALLVDEEREEAPEPSGSPVVFDGQPKSTAGPDEAAPDGPSVAGLSADDAAILRSLLDGTYDAAAVRARGVMASLVADRINEAFYDIVGDAVIEFEGDEPRIVSDYVSDVREALS